MTDFFLHKLKSEGSEVTEHLLSQEPHLSAETFENFLQSPKGLWGDKGNDFLLSLPTPHHLRGDTARGKQKTSRRTHPCRGGASLLYMVQGGSYDVTRCVKLKPWVLIY